MDGKVRYLLHQQLTKLTAGLCKIISTTYNNYHINMVPCISINTIVLIIFKIYYIQTKTIHIK